jgi:surfeit locus 1 family protein
LKELQQLTHENYLPFILQLDPSEPNGFERNWVNITVPPERHVGYAIQWLAFAIIILIGFICFCSEKVEAANDK